MYTSYSTTTLALRAKGSFYHTHLSLCNDYRAQTCPRNCLSCCHSSLYNLRRNPRFLLYNYLLRRHSTSIQLETSRSFLLARRGVRVSRRSQDFDGSFQEVIGLLSEECSGLNSKGDAVIKSTGEDFKKSARKEGFCSKCNAVNKSVDGDFKKSSRREGFCGGVRREGSSSSYDSANSSSFSGDYEHGRVGSRRIGRADVEEKEIREVRKYEIDANFGRDSRKESKKKAFDQRIRDGEEKVDSWMDSAREAREKHVRDGQEESRKELEFWERNGSTRVASSSKREGFDRRIRDGEDKFDSWRGLAREASEEYVLEEQEGSRKLTKSSNTESYSGSKNVSNEWKVDRGESSTSFVNQHREVDQRVAGQAESRKSSQYGSDVERVAVSQRRFEEERMKDREDRSTSVENLVKVTIDERSLMDQRAVDKMELKKQHETHTSASRIRASYTERANSSKSYLEIRTDAERASNSQRRFEEERMDRENRSTSVQNIVQVTRDKRTQLNHQAAEKMEVNKEYDARTNASRSHASNTEKASSSKSSPEIRTDDREDHSTSVVNLVHGASGRSRIESEMDSNVSEFRRCGRERVSISQEISNVRQENRKETSSILVQDKKEKQRSTIIGQSSQSTKTQLDLSESLDGGSGSVDQSKNDAIESASRLDKSSAMYVGEFLNKLRQEISTSDNSEKMEETHGGTSRATTGVEVSVDDATTRYKEEKYIEEGGWQSSSRSGMKGPPDEMWEVRGMSSQEPSKIEEHEEDSSAMEVVDSKASPGITDTAINRRSHRSLWTYIAGIIKMSWGQRAGSHNSTEKSGTRSSSNESISSEAWFSGHEPDENDDETGKKGRNNRLPREPVPTKRPVEQPHLDSSISMGTMLRGSSSTGASLVSGVEDKEWSEGEKGRRVLLSSVVTVDQSSALTGPTASSSTTEIGNVQIPRSGLPKSEEEFGRAKLPDAGGTEGKGGEFEGRNGSPKESVPTERPVEQSHLGSSTSMGTMRRGLSSKSVSLVSGAEEIEWTEGEKGRQGIVSSVVTVGQSSALTGILPSPSVTSIGSVQMPGSGLPKLEDKLPEVGGAEGKDGELKRRKLQRSKQVLEEQFDEWEEAYKRDSEQRKIDEFFMREALLEAKKAADTWEVPVGAVLVQNGKIIARGCNLVEELRDSTAHAEMICIREASNLLRTWRLADTTLYVTLEPCPMCAGAILQARIDTVVWGAPNKLLGADGSWVRLFPGGDGGSSSLDPSNQTAGPIHPFHPKIVIRRGILATECSDVMQQFFQLRRKKNKKPEQPPPPSCLPISTHRTKLFTKMHHIFCMMFCL